jgi:tetratricopeptide (TPR) repeat protein
MACAGILNGCSWLGLGGGKTAPSKVESRQEAPKPDAFAQTRAQMSAFPREPYWPYHLAELYLDADSTTEAIGNLQTALTVNPDYAPAVSLLSRVYYDRRMHAQAVTLLEDYLSRNAQAPDALRASLALNYEALGEADKADAALASCATDSREADCARVLAMLRQNDRTAMLSTAQKALDDDKHSAANHNNYGIALLVAGRPFEARDEFRAALDLNDGLAGALYNMAIVESFYFFDDAAGRDWYTRYLRVDSADPDNLKAHFDADVSSTEPPADRSKP